MMQKLSFPNPYGNPLPKEEEVLAVQRKYGFSDTLAQFYRTQNGLRGDAEEIVGIPVELDGHFLDLRCLYSLEQAVEQVKLLFVGTATQERIDAGDVESLQPYFSPSARTWAAISLWRCCEA